MPDCGRMPGPGLAQARFFMIPVNFLVKVQVFCPARLKYFDSCPDKGLTVTDRVAVKRQASTPDRTAGKLAPGTLPFS
jgi:hypothetical protein